MKIKAKCITPYPCYSPKNKNQKAKENVPSNANTNKQCKSNDITQKHPKWTIEQFEIGPILGKGAYGEVRIAREKKSGAIVALKHLSKDEIITKSLKCQLKNEIEMQSKLCHTNIIRLYQIFDDPFSIYLILEYANNGSLFNLLQKAGPFNECEVARIIKTVAVTLQYLHDHNIIHRDIKPENLLYCSDQIKISDFGCCSDSINERRTLCGTPMYIAPEILRNEKYDFTVDIWSLGILAYELLAGPFNAEQAALLMSSMQIKYIFPQPVSVLAKQFLEFVLYVIPSRRPTITQILSHEWICKYNV